MGADILDQDATAQLAALAARQVSAVELLASARVRQVESHPRLNLVVAQDGAAAEAAARAVDAARSRGEALGGLAGLPMTIKDTFDVAGLPASAGLPAFLDRACEDALVVAKVRGAGAVIWGKTNVPVMAGDWQSYNEPYGVSGNPWDPARTPGGSSGGAAGSLAMGIAALEIGSDIGGSLRVPANFCGVYSHKPSWGAISQRGHVPPVPGTLAARDLNVVGPMARSARDLKLLFSIIAEAPGAAHPTPSLNGLRVGLWLDEPHYPLDPQVRSVIEAYAKALAAAGVVVEPIKSPVNARALKSAYQTLLGSIIGSDFPPGQQEQMQAMRPAAKQAIAAGEGPDSAMAMILAYTASHAEWLAADEVRAGLRHEAEQALARFDVILAPVTPVAAFPHDHRAFADRVLTLSTGGTIPYTSMLDWIGLATACHLPSTCVPAGLTETGLPVGVQLIGPPGGDQLTLAVAEAFEAVRGFTPPP